MALTSNNIELIKAVANNDLERARKAAIASVAEDSSKKNASVLAAYKKTLLGCGLELSENIPANLKSILVGVPPRSFRKNKYYIREADKKIADDVITMKYVSEEMALHDIPYKNTTLLYGKPGTGKTELGKYIAYRLNLPFFYISFSSAIDSYMGSTAKNLHNVFSFCNTIPCILMLDEVDCIATKRESSGGKGCDGELERTTISLMQELDRLQENVIVIAATNRLDLIDEAMLRRFSIKHEVADTSKEELEALARQYVKATRTGTYISEEEIASLSQKAKNPGDLVPELIRTIGKAVYREKKEEFINEPVAGDNADEPKTWDVTYTWTTSIKAYSEEDAIAIGRKERTTYGHTGTEKYSAKAVACYETEVRHGYSPNQTCI